MIKKILRFILKIVEILLIIILSIFIYVSYIETKQYSQEDNDINNKLSVIEENNSINLEEISKNVVGISKIKEKGTSVLLYNSVKELELGSGVIVDKNGYILTNQHVVGFKGESCYITTYSGEIYEGIVKWENKDIDIAIVKVDIKFNTEINIGESDSLNIGEDVYAIGNPIGYEFQRTITKGIVSGTNRTVKIKNENEEYIYMNNLIQTDATINQGNSGGPLIDKYGKVVGINTIKITSADGIGFAIPINIVKPIIKSYKQKGDFKEPHIGIYAYDNSFVKTEIINNNSNKGIYIEKISKNTPAFNSELKEGDLIIKVDNTNIEKMCELQEYIFSKNIGDEIYLTIKRKNEEKQIKIILEEKEGYKTKDN